MAARNARPEIELIHARHLHPNPKPGCQRVEGVNPREVQRKVDDWNPLAIGTLTASRQPDGEVLLADGAHRAEAARRIGWRHPLPVLVHEGLSQAQEAALFRLLNDFKSPSVISKLYSRVSEGDPIATDIVRIIESHGWRIGNEKPGRFRAVVAAERVYTTAAGTLPRGEHSEVLDRAVGIITASWGLDEDAAHGAILMGISQLIGRLGDEIDSSSLAHNLSLERPLILRAKATALQASQGGTVPAAVAKVTAGIYNSRRRKNKLPEWVWTR